MTWVACPKNDWLEIYQIVLRIDDQFCLYLVTLYLGQMDPKSKTQIAGMIFGVKKAEPILKLNTGSSISPWIGLVRALFQQRGGPLSFKCWDQPVPLVTLLGH